MLLNIDACSILNKNCNIIIHHNEFWHIIIVFKFQINKIEIIQLINYTSICILHLRLIHFVTPNYSYVLNGSK